MQILLELEICADCAIVAANDDWSGVSDEHGQAIRDGFDRLDGHLVVGDELGFSWSRCEVCNGLAGDRYRAVLVGAEVAA
jgi:hypothetical protein